MKYINPNLITLKCVLFLFFGAIGSLFPFLPIHMTAIGLSKDESIVVLGVSAFVAILGPLIACPLADRLAGGFGGASRSKTGKYLRVMITLCLLLATLFYWLLMTVPLINRSQKSVTFACDPNGGYILQDRCGKERSCYNFDKQRGNITVSNCFYACNVTTPFPTKSPQEAFTITTTPTPVANYGDHPDYLDNDEDSSGLFPVESVPDAEEDQERKTAKIMGGWVPHPHLCYFNTAGAEICEVYTNNSKSVHFNLGLQSNKVENTEERCNYAFDDHFSCRITSDILRLLSHNETLDENCHPMILCKIDNPYNLDSLLYGSQCGSYDNISYFLYILIKSLGDIFIAAAVALIATAVVIATRETSTGRGDVGKQLVFGALGFGIFAPIIGGAAKGMFCPAMISFTVLMMLASLILLFDSKMPLSPPEWWWHTRCGLLALPMSSVRKFGLETGALGFVLLLLGIFWNAIDAFMPLRLADLEDESYLIIGLTYTIGAIPAIIYLIFAEKFVDFCGHSNILIYCFANYIIHHIGLILIKDATVLLFLELLEIFTLHIMYVTAVMYLRHLVARKFTSCGQGLLVIAHFCLGRGIGVFLGGLAYTDLNKNFKYVHMRFAIMAAVVGMGYFLLYHGFLKPQCAAAPQVPPAPAPPILNSMNGNGSYSPLRVYHFGKAKKGHFRY